jgi:hypothetical protein
MFGLKSMLFMLIQIYFAERIEQFRYKRAKITTRYILMCAVTFDNYCAIFYIS